MKNKNRVSIRQAHHADHPRVAVLFDLYRQFYGYEADAQLALDFVAARLLHDESVVFIAVNAADEPLGFVQLYPSFSSTLAGKVWILYDLFVMPDARGIGIGRALMERAIQLGRDTGAVEINLATAKNNHSAQSLYQSLGYQRDDDFWVYTLDPHKG